MGKKKTYNLRCIKCKVQTECTSLDESLRDVRCGLNGGHIDDSCKVNLQLDGKPIFEITQVVEFGKKIKKEEPPEEVPPSEPETPEDVPENTTPDVAETETKTKTPETKSK